MVRARASVSFGAFVIIFFLLTGYAGDLISPMASEDMEPGCHPDYYLWAIPAGEYCMDVWVPIKPDGD